MIVLDTNVVSELMKSQPDANVQNWLSVLDHGNLATTTITVTEIEFGLQRLPNGKRKTQLYANFEVFLNEISVLPFDTISARLAGQFWALRHGNGFTAQSADMMIAGIVAASEATLSTRNLKDFDQLPIQIIDPWRTH